MLRHRLFPLALTSSLLLAACQLPQGELTLQVRPELTSSARQVLAAGYTASDIHHLDIRLSRMEGGTPSLIAEAEVPGAALGSTLNFGNLRMNSVYTIAAVAYADQAETEVLTDEASSQVELSVGQDPVVAPVTVPVKLKKQVQIIPGTQGSTTLEIQPGAWITPTPTPTPTPTATPTPPSTVTISATFKWQDFMGPTMAIEDIDGGIFSSDQGVPIDGNGLFTIPSFSLSYNTSHRFRVWWTGGPQDYKSDIDARVGDLTATVDASGAVTWSFLDYDGNAYPDTVTLQ